MANHQPDRLRPPPRERFADDLLFFDLDRRFEALQQEAHSGTDGHRQFTLFKGHNLTHLAILFDTAGFLPRHSTDALITLHVLDGFLDLSFKSEPDSLLGPHSLTIIQPGSPFSLKARQPARVLMTLTL